MVLLLRKTKIKDVASLHRIIVALEYYLTHLIIALHDPRLICLTRLEEMTVDNSKSSVPSQIFKYLA